MTYHVVPRIGLYMALGFSFERTTDGVLRRISAEQVKCTFELDLKM